MRTLHLQQDDELAIMASMDLFAAATATKPVAALHTAAVLTFGMGSPYVEVKKLAASQLATANVPADAPEPSLAFVKLGVAQEMLLHLVRRPCYLLQ